MNSFRAFCLIVAGACGVNLYDVPARMVFAVDSRIPAFPGAMGFGAMTPVQEACATLWKWRKVPGS